MHFALEGTAANAQDLGSAGTVTVSLFEGAIDQQSFIVIEVERAMPGGALTAAGVASLIIGALVLFNSPATPEFQRVSVPLVVVTSLMTGGVFAVALAFAIRAQQTPIRMGQETLVGRIGTVKQEIPTFGSGQVQLASERWTAELAEGERAIPMGTRVEVVEVQGVRLKVKAVE